MRRGERRRCARQERHQDLSFLTPLMGTLIGLMHLIKIRDDRARARMDKRRLHLKSLDRPLNNLITPQSRSYANPHGSRTYLIPPFSRYYLLICFTHVRVT